MSKKLPVVCCQLSREALADLVNIENEVAVAPWSENLFAQEFVNQSAGIIGARTKGQLVGFLVYRAMVDEAHILNIGVKKAFHRQGIGRGLLSYALRENFEKGLKWATLEVRESNFSARKLYESMGFAEVGVRENYYSNNNEDAIIMSLNLLQYVDHFGEDDVVGF